MRIGISTSVIQRGKSGVGQYLLALLKAFRPYTGEHEWTLFVLEEDLPLLEFNRDCMQIVAVPEKHRAPIQNILWHQTRLPTLIRQHRLDILHVPSYRRLLWPKPCALVGTIHDLAPFHVTRKYDWKRMFYGRVIARKLARRQDRIIAISQNTREDILRFFQISSSRISLVHNGIDHDRFFPGSQAEARASAARDFGLHGPFFLYVARLEHPAKNHLRLISAFEKFKLKTRSDWSLVFGGSDWHGAETIHATIGRSQFKSDIRSLGFVPDGALPNLYRAAEVFIYPSLFEGFGLPPVEAMACNCPVICSTRGSLGEVLGTAAAIIEPEDEETITEKMFQLASDEKERNRLRVAGLTQAKKFDWKQTAEATLRVYDSVKPARPE